MIKTVIFDLGNVILPFDVYRLANRLSSYSPCSADEIVHKLWANGIGIRFEKGHLTPTDYFEEAKESCGFNNLTFNEFIALFNDIFNENTDVSQIVHRLKPDYKLGLISNTNEIHANHVVETYSVLSKFDKLWFSNDAGVRKPDPSIYQMALDHFDVTAQESVFIDDMPENIEAAHEIGFKAILFKDAPSLEEDLTKIGVF